MNGLYEDTICAISTPNGMGGIAVVRVSGPKAFEICEKVFVPIKASGEQASSEKPAGALQGFASYSCHYGHVKQANGEIFDDVMLSLFRAPHSYTGEDTVELSCHGSLFIQQQLLQALISAGCRYAQAGEYTKRAFLNGKMDLSQAEAVADLIAANSASANKIALKQMRGGFSDELAQLREKLLHITSLIELELDFSEEDVTFANREELRNLAFSIDEKITSLCNSFKWGNVIKNGIPVAIVGETNAGKSTLLNLLLNEEKAIVSDIHGTTRDSIEDCISIQGIPFRFIDTAGLRETKDKIEKLGMERTYQKIEQASIVLWMIDSTHVTEHIEWMADRIVPRAVGKKLLLIFNKKDKITLDEKNVIDNLFSHIPGEHLHISAKNKENTDLLQAKLIEMTNTELLQQNDTIVTNLRHYEALSAGLEAIRRVEKGLEDNLSGDFIAQDIRECLYYLGLITGNITNEEVLSSIFRGFCIGK